MAPFKTDCLNVGVGLTHQRRSPRGDDWQSASSDERDRRSFDHPLDDRRSRDLRDEAALRRLREDEGPSDTYYEDSAVRLRRVKAFEVDQETEMMNYEAARVRQDIARRQLQTGEKKIGAAL